MSFAIVKHESNTPTTVFEVNKEIKGEHVDFLVYHHSAIVGRLKIGENEYQTVYTQATSFLKEGELYSQPDPAWNMEGKFQSENGLIMTSPEIMELSSYTLADFDDNAPPYITEELRELAEIKIGNVTVSDLKEALVTMNAQKEQINEYAQSAFAYDRELSIKKYKQELEFIVRDEFSHFYIESNEYFHTGTNQGYLIHNGSVENNIIIDGVPHIASYRQGQSHHYPPTEVWSLATERTSPLLKKIDQLYEQDFENKDSTILNQIVNESGLSKEQLYDVYLALNSNHHDARQYAQEIFDNPDFTPVFDELNADYEKLCNKYCNKKTKRNGMSLK